MKTAIRLPWQKAPSTHEQYDPSGNLLDVSITDKVEEPSLRYLVSLRRPARCLAWQIGSALAGLGAAHSSVAQLQDPFDYRPTATIQTVSPSLAPQIDGVLDDEVWLSVEPIRDFYQSDPVEGAIPSEETSVTIVHDGDTLYIGAVLHVREQRNIIGTIQERDGEIWDDDQFRIQFDTYDTGRDAYGFMVNPLGSRYDYLVENNSSINSYWDTIWQAKVARGADGWTVEMAVPLQSLPHDVSAATWGMQIVRVIRSRNEVIRWSTVTQSLSSVDMSIAGSVTGIRGSGDKARLDLQGFVGASWNRKRIAGAYVNDTSFDPSGNIFYRITPSMTGTLTVNTDFSDTPLDARQVNTSRFSLFFPEVREFFLQDAAIFQFGGANFENDVNGTPFFSRRIGIVDGQPVDIRGGVKLSGSQGRINIGALAAETKDAAGIDRQQLSTVRVAADILDESRAGVIATIGDPTGASDNRVIGMDFLYRNSHLFPGRQLAADTFVLSSRTDGLDDSAYGAYVSSPKDAFSWNIGFKRLGENFQPRLGFANRTGIWRYNAGAVLNVRPQDSWLRLASIEAYATVFTNLSGNTESQEFKLQHCGESDNGEQWCINASSIREIIDERFFLPMDIAVDPADYRYVRARIQGKTSPVYPASLSLAYEFGNYLGGTRRDLEITLESRLSQYLRANVSYTWNRIRLPTGRVDIRITSANINVNFTPEMQFASQIQYDNVSRRLACAGRYSWEFRPQSELFLSLSQNYIGEPGSFQSMETGLTFRIGNTFRF